MGKGKILDSEKGFKCSVSYDKDTYKSDEKSDRPFFPHRKKHRISPVIVDVYHHVGIFLSPRAFVRPIDNIRSKVDLVNH